MTAQTGSHGDDNRILIAGGGIGGLATALSLAQRDIASRVLERRDTVIEDGAGIQIGPNGVHVLRELGIFDQVLACAATPDDIVVGDAASGRGLIHVPLGQHIANRFSAPYLTMARPHLYAALSAAARAHPLIAIHHGITATGFVQDARSVEVCDDNGHRYSGAALIAADGAWSRLRNTICPDGQSASTGKVAFRTIASVGSEDGPESRSVHVWLGAKMHVVHYPVDSGRRLAIVVIVDDPAITQGWNAAPDMAQLQRAIDRTHARLKALLNGAANWRMWSLHAMPTLRHITDRRVALLGDAAHPVLPFLAQGAVMALEDASVIARCLGAGGGPSDAGIAQGLQSYATQRQARTAKVANASKRNGKIYHLSAPVAVARDAYLRLQSGDRLLRAYDWLYGWRPE